MKNRNYVRRANHRASSTAKDMSYEESVDSRLLLMTHKSRPPGFYIINLLVEVKILLAIITGKMQKLPDALTALAVVATAWANIEPDPDISEMITPLLLCELMRLRAMKPFAEWPFTAKEMMDAYALIDPEWDQDSTRTDISDRVPSPSVQAKIEDVMARYGQVILSLPNALSAGCPPGG